MYFDNFHREVQGKQCMEVRRKLAFGTKRATTWTDMSGTGSDPDFHRLDRGRQVADAAMRRDGQEAVVGIGRQCPFRRL
jgi:hypothetical protein